MEIKDKLVVETIEASQIITTKTMEDKIEDNHPKNIKRLIQEFCQALMVQLICNGEKESECQNILLEMKRQKNNISLFQHMDKMDQNRITQMDQKMKKKNFHENKEDQSRKLKDNKKKLNNKIFLQTNQNKRLKQQQQSLRRTKGFKKYSPFQMMEVKRH